MFSTLVDCCQFKVSMHCQSSNFLGSLSQGHPPEHRIFEQSSRWSHFSKVEKAPIKNPLQSCETKMDGFGLNRRGTVVDGTFWVGAHFPIIVVNSRFIFIGIPKPEKCNVFLVVTIWLLLKRGQYTHHLYSCKIRCPTAEETPNSQQLAKKCCLDDDPAPSFRGQPSFDPASTHRFTLCFSSVFQAHSGKCTESFYKSQVWKLKLIFNWAADADFGRS